MTKKEITSYILSQVADCMVESADKEDGFELEYENIIICLTAKEHSLLKKMVQL